MASADGLMLVAGGLAFAGNFKKEGGFPPNGYGIIAATAALSFLAATSKNSALEGPVKALAGLMLLAAIYAYIPGLMTNETKKRKAKKNG